MIGDRIFEALKAHPFALALVIINALFLSYVVHEVSASGARRDAMITELARDCARTKGDRQ